MAKRPTPKKRRAKSATKTQRSAYQIAEARRLSERLTSPYAGPAEPKNKAKKALKNVTRIQA